MQKLLMDNYFDEFNLMYSHNIALSEIDRNEKQFYIDTTETFDILFNDYDFVINSRYNYFTTDFFGQLIKYRDEGIKEGVVNDFYEKVIGRIKEYCEENNIKRYVHDFIDHPYKKTFSLISKKLQDETLNFIEPKESDYLKAKSFVSKIDKPIVCITGRNLPKDTYKNDFLKRWIEESLYRGAYVINVTTPCPDLYYYSEDCYKEFDENIFTYSEMVSWFLNSNIVIALGSSGGISNHLCTRANIAVYLDNVHWVNNPKYGHNDLSIVQSRKTNKDIHTSTVYNNYHILDELIKLPKPEQKTFFDESKLIWI